VDYQVAEISDRVTQMDIDANPRSSTVLEEDGGDGDADYAVAGEHVGDDGSVDDDRDVAEAIVAEAKGGNGAPSELSACAAFCKGIFREAAAPLLPRLATSPSRSRGHKRAMVTTRSSLRQAARPSPVPVSQRAQRKLMRELQFIDTPTAPPDAAATEYIDLYGHELPPQAMDAIRSAARMGNKKLAKVLASMAAEAGAMEMEVP
jgi:hypothetical protein